VCCFVVKGKKYARIHPSLVSVEVGNEVRFSCHNLYPKHAKWEFNHGYITGYAEQSGDNQILIKHAHLNNTGYYSCFAKYNHQDYSNEPFVAVALLKVYGEWELVYNFIYNKI